MTDLEKTDDLWVEILLRDEELNKQEPAIAGFLLVDRDFPLRLVEKYEKRRFELDAEERLQAQVQWISDLLHDRLG